MTITIELPPEIHEWVSRKIEGGEYRSPAEFVQSRLCCDWLEEKVEEALIDPAAPLTHEDWAEARRRLEHAILQNR